MSLSNQLYINDIVSLSTVEIRATGPALRIYSPINASTPVFEIDSTTGMKINGDLSVIGTVTFEDSKVNEISSPLTFVGSGNTGDTYDLGIVGEYVSAATTKYAGIYRNSSDTLRRWTLFDGITTKPTTTVTGLSSSALSSLLADKVYVNDGSALAPSITFDQATGLGFYKSSATALGLVANGSETTFSTTGIQMPNSHTLQLGNLSPRSFNTLSGLVTSGAVNMTSATNQDAWSSYNSVSSAFAGSVYTGSTTSYFVTNDTNILRLSSLAAVSTTTPDYRNATAQLSLSTTFARFNQPLQVPYGSLALGSLALSFTLEQTLGIYRATANTLSLVANLERVLDVSNTNVTSNKPLVVSVTSPSTSSPAIQFPNSAGIFPAAGVTAGLTLTLGSTVGDAIQMVSFSSKPQVFLPYQGTVTNPALAVVNNGTGLYSDSTGTSVSFAAQAVNCASLTSTLATFPSTINVPGGYFGATSRYSTNSIGSAAIQVSGGLYSGGNIVLDPAPIEARNIILGYYGTTSNAATDISDANRTATVSTTALSGNPVVATYTSDVGNLKTIKYAIDFASENSLLSGTRVLSLTPYISTYSGLTNFCIAFWYKLSTISSAACIFHAYSGSKEIAIEVLASGLFQIKVNSDTTNTLLATVSGTNTNGVWQHIAVNFGSGGLVFYRNGVSAAVSGTLTVVTNTGPTNCFANLSGISVLTIGARWDGTQMTNKFPGHLARIYMTPTVLTQSQISFFQSDTQKFVGYEADLSSVRARSILLDDTTAALTLPVGSAASPPINFTGSASSGLFFESSPEASVSVSVSGTKALGVGASTVTATRPVRISGTGPALQFENVVAGGGVHSVSSAHAGTLSGNSVAVKLWSTADTVGALGSHVVATFQQRSATVGQVVADEFLSSISGTASNPIISFVGDPDTGCYNSSSNTFSITTGGANRADFTTTGLSVNGTLSLPTNAGSGFSITFDDSTTGIRSVSGDLTLLIKNVSSMTFTNSLITANLPFAVKSTSATALRIQNASGEQMFAVNTTATSEKGVQFGYDKQTLRSPNGSSATNQFLNLESSQTSGVQGLQIVSLSSSTLNGIPAFISLGYDYSNARAGMMAFRHTGVAGADGTLSLGMGANGVFTTECMRITPTEVQFLVPLTTSTALQFSNVIGLASGSVSSPSLYVGSVNTGLYSALAGTVSISAAGTNAVTFSSSAITAAQPVRLAAGSAGAPALTLSSDSTTGVYGTAGNFRVAASSTPVFNFNSASTEALTNFAITPNGTNTRVTFTNAKMTASPGQTILAGVPVLHLDYTSDPNTYPSQQDASINKTTIQVNGTVTYNTNLINLTDANGTTLYATQAIETSSTGNNSIETTGSLSSLTLMSVWSAICQFKVKSVSGTQLIWGLYGNKAAFTNNYIEVYHINTALFIAIRLNGSNLLVAQLNTPIAVNIWYKLRVDVSGVTVGAQLNGVTQTFTYTTGSAATGFAFNLFTDTTNLAVYNCASPNRNSLGLYLYEFAIIPTTISQAASIYYTQQSHELYTNKLQLQPVNTSTGLATGIPEEGAFMISDSGGTASWDTSIKATPTTVTTSSTKTLVSGSAGTAAQPALAITSSGGSPVGLYSSGASVLNLSVGQASVASFSTTTFTNSLATTIPAGSAGAPSVNFVGSTTSGLFSAGANDTSISSAGTSVLSLTSARALFATPVRLPLGSAGAPSLTSSSSSTTGLYFFNSGDSIAAAIQGADALQLSSSALTSLVTLQVPNGTVSSPGLRFAASATTGVYSSATNNVDISISGTNRVNFAGATTTFTSNIVATGSTPSVQILATNSASGTATATLNLQTSSAARAGGILFGNTTTSTNGAYFGTRYGGGSAIGQLTLQGSTTAWSAGSAGGNSTGLDLLIISMDTGSMQCRAGSVSAPTITFQGNTNTGFYSSGTNNLDFSTAGSNRLNISSTGSTFAGTLTTGTGVTTMSGPVARAVQSLATNTTLSATTGGSLIVTTAAVTLTLPAATAGLEFYIVNSASGSTVIQTQTPASEYFNGNPALVSLTLEQHGHTHLVCVGTNWYTF